MLLLLEKARSHDMRTIVLYLDAEAQGGAAFECIGIKQLADCLGHAGRIRAIIPRIAQRFDNRLAAREQDNVLSIAPRSGFGRIARRSRSVFRYDAHAEG